MLNPTATEVINAVTNIRSRAGESEDATLSPPEGRDELTRRTDPAPTSLQLAEKQLLALLDGITDDPIKELRELRDEIDDTIRVYQDNQKALSDLLTHHREIGESAKALKPIAADAMRELQTRLKSQTVAVKRLINQPTQKTSQ